MVGSVCKTKRTMGTSRTAHTWLQFQQVSGSLRPLNNPVRGYVERNLKLAVNTRPLSISRIIQGRALCATRGRTRETNNNNELTNPFSCLPT